MTNLKSHDPVAINDCLRDADFAILLSVGGDKVQEVCIHSTDTIERSYTLAVKLKKHDNVFFLSTAREPGKPRVFKTVETAISAGKGFFVSGQLMIFKVLIHPPDR